MIKQVNPSKAIRSKFSLYQHNLTGEIEVIHDYRSHIRANFKCIIDWTHYYPHVFPSPFAAYLIPKDIQIGEHVWLEDVIEDFVEAEWNQGSAFRLRSCEAIWTGKDLDIQFDPEKDKSDIIG